MSAHADQRSQDRSTRDDGAVPDSISPPVDLRPHLPDLENPFEPSAARSYDPVELVRLALAWPTDYWPGLALNWLDEGVPAVGLVEELGVFEQERCRPQAQRHQARRLRKAARG
jgi:hypothetical protein